MGFARGSDQIEKLDLAIAACRQPVIEVTR